MVLLTGLALGVLGWRADDQDFSVDESRWIATSRYFWITFLERDLFGPAWQPNYLVLTHPPVARYAIGFGLWLQGWTPDGLNGRYDTDRSREFNRQRGNIPTDELLDAARRVVFVFALASTLLLYPIGRVLAESVLAFFTLLAFLLAARVAALYGKQAAGRGVAYGWPLGLGLALGLASATKLTGVLGGVGLAVFGVLQYALRWWQTRRWPGLGLWPDAALMALLVFMLVNPLLYPDPLARTVMLFEHRRDEMREQALGTPRLAVPDDLGVRAALLSRRTFLEYGTFQRWLGVPLDAVLMTAGLAIALVLSWRTARRAGMLGPPALLFCWTVATYAVTTVNLGFDSSHYVALPVLWCVLLEALALGTLLTAVARLAARRLSRSQRDMAVTAQAS
jgi:hypothetical protein